MSEPTLPRALRALRALPLLLTSAFMIYAFRFAAPLTDFYAPAVEAGVLTLQDGVRSPQDDIAIPLVIPLITRFYKIAPLDFVLSQIMVAFAQVLSFPADVEGYWHMLVFLLEFTGLYGVMLLESCRGGYRGSWLRFPGVVFLLGQFVTVGSVFPIYLFILYITKSASKFSAADRRIPAAEAEAMLPAIILGYLSSAVPSLLHPNIFYRQWWSWLWQLYPIWTALFLRPLTKIFQSPSPTAAASIAAIRRTVFVLVAIGTVTYWYTLLESGLSLTELYLPRYLLESPASPPEALRTVIRYDYVTTYLATLTWLALELRDAKKGGLSGFAGLGVAGVVAAVVLGPGSVMTLGWWWREEALNEERDGKKKE